MNGRILKFDDSAHREADEVLPWFVNGTLKDGELAAVEQHLRECVRCRREVDLLKQLQSVCALDGPAMDATPAYRRLHERIANGGRRGSVRALLRSLRQPWQTVPPWAKWAIVTELAGIVALGAMVLSPLSGSDALYHTLGATAAHVPRHDAVAVKFAPATTEAELQRILRASGARLIDGPTESNAYVVEVPHDQRAASLASLRSESAVTLAQPLTIGPTR